jgi:hypothetical protein
MHSRNVLRAHFPLTQVLLSILDPLTSNSSLYLLPLNQHPVFAVIFKSNCCWQNPLKAGCSPLLTVKVQLLLFRGQVILEPALKILCSILFRSYMNLSLNLFIPGSGHAWTYSEDSLFNPIQVLYEPVIEPPYSGVRSYMNLFWRVFSLIIPQRCQVLYEPVIASFSLFGCILSAVYQISLWILPSVCLILQQDCFPSKLFLTICLSPCGSSAFPTVWSV